MKEGIIACEDAHKGALKGKKFREVLALAASQGLIDIKAVEQANINPIVLAKDLMDDYEFAVDKDTNELYYYVKAEGIYSNNTEQLLNREIADRLDENFKTYYYTEISAYITAKAPLVDLDRESPEQLAVKNGLLNIATGELQPFNPKVYLTGKLNVNWNPDKIIADSYFHNFLNRVLPNKTQQQQVQELIGHCLYKGVITETTLVLLGKGENGKSILLQTNKALLGDNNISSHSIQNLCYDKFTTEQIKGKFANICTDLPHKEILNTSIYKALVSGDPVQAYIKHAQKTVSFQPFAKYLFSANALPPIKSEEDCYAWYRRFALIDFNQTFTKEEIIPRPELLTKLSTPDELSAQLNWAVEGYQRLKWQGEITGKPTAEQIRKEYRRRSSTTLSYFDDQVTVTDSPADWVFTADWFRDYVTYCQRNSLKAKSKGEFVKDIESNLSGVRHTKKRPEPKASPLSTWEYLKVVPCVPLVPQSQSKSLPHEKSDNFSYGSHKLKNSGTNGTGGTDLTCFANCANFRKPSCDAPDWQVRTEDAVKPLKCGFKRKEASV